MYIRTEYEPNADVFSSIKYYICDKCGESICESDVHWENEGKTIQYCWDCAFKIGVIDSTKYCKFISIGLRNIRAAVNPKNECIEIIYGSSRYFSWQAPEKNSRNSKIYSTWRETVFKRDNYTCQHCQQRGGTLNAHHIESYAKNKKLRFELSNGITLCEKCHKKEHKQLREKSKNLQETKNG